MPSPSDRGRCPNCGQARRLKLDGRLPVHTYTLDISRRATHTVGSARVTRRCPGSDQPPKGAPS